MEAEIKRLVERPDAFLKDGSNQASHMIEAIQNKIKGRKQMSKLIERAKEREAAEISHLVNLADGKDPAKATSAVNNLPNYMDSQVWQDLIRMKAN